MNVLGKRHVKIGFVNICECSGQETCRTNQTYKYSVHVFVKNKIAVYCAKLHVTCESSGKDLGSNSLHGTHAKLNFNSEHHVMVHNILHTQLASTNQTLYQLGF